jgi:hypothetical protein
MGTKSDGGPAFPQTLTDNHGQMDAAFDYELSGAISDARTIRVIEAKTLPLAICLFAEQLFSRGEKA